MEKKSLHTSINDQNSNNHVLHGNSSHPNLDSLLLSRLNKKKKKKKNVLKSKISLEGVNDQRGNHDASGPPQIYYLALQEDEKGNQKGIPFETLEKKNLPIYESIFFSLTAFPLVLNTAKSER